MTSCARRSPAGRARFPRSRIHAERERRLEAVLPEAFAAVKNAARRMNDRQHTFTVCDMPVTWNMVHFDVQLIGGICLHRGMISEMATGEGKTLVATLALFLNALAGRGAHLVTTNDYLARRDSEWMGQLYGFLGLTTGVHPARSAAGCPPASMYACDITYGMNSEFGFDYLRDNGMATSQEQQVQRGHNYAIVDEVDSILIDEARVPLIISGPATVSTHQFDKYKPIVDAARAQADRCFATGSTPRPRRRGPPASTRNSGSSMFKVKLGQPRNKGLMRAMEDPEKRRAIEKAELSFYADARKEELFALKEELFFTIDERAHESDLSDQGREFMSPDDPDAFVLPDLMTQFAEIDQDTRLDAAQKIEEKAKRQAYMDQQSERIHNISQLLRAYCLFEKDVQYVVEEGKVVIVDEFTGRKMTGRRWSDGLHGAVEAKEGVVVDKETQTLATITIQNYFRLYQKLAGMTGTAETEANEFSDVYKLQVAVIPTNQPVRAAGPQRSHLQDAPREVQRRHQRDQDGPCEEPAGARRHGQRRAERDPFPHAQARENPARGAQREVPHAGGRDRRARRPAGLRHHLHEHGRPRHRHQARAGRARCRRPVRRRHGAA